jgi:hypothetical protein
MIMSILRRVFVIGVISAMLPGVAFEVQAAEAAKNEPAIREVQSGQRKVANAAWWGFQAEESTAALQAAIDSGAEKVIVEKMPSPWIVNKIQLASNQELYFEPGVVVQAKKGAFHGKSDALFTARDKANVKLTGYGATLRMQRDDYDGPDYSHAEWRHALTLHGCTNVTVLGLTLAESGGDGIYLGSSRGQTNRNVVIRDVTCDRNYRQGISVITAENLLIENCVLKDTKGTAPEAGIDFEPNLPTERLVNCVMRKCTIENNRGYAIHIYARQFNGTTAPMSIRIEDCVTRGINARSASVITSCGKEGAVQGKVEFVNCRFEDVGHTGINIGSKPPRGIKLRLVNCTLADPAEQPAAGSPIHFSTHQGDLENLGGVELVDCVLREKVERPVMKFDNITDARIVDITGKLTVERQGQRTVYSLDQKLLDQWFPYDPVVEIRPQTLDGVRLEPVAATPTSGVQKVPAHRLRQEATYVLYAKKGDAVALRVKSSRVGRSDGKPVALRVLNPAGKEIHKSAVPFQQEADCQFTADQTGTFTILAQPENHTVQVVSSTHPVCMASTGRGVFHLLGTTGDFYFWVPAEVREFGLRFKGEGDGERISAAVLNPAGKTVWEQPNISTAQSFRFQRAAASKGEVWHLRLSRPTVGVLEDTYLELRGLPPVVGFTANSVLRPATEGK